MSTMNGVVTHRTPVLTGRTVVGTVKRTRNRSPDLQLNEVDDGDHGCLCKVPGLLSGRIGQSGTCVSDSQTPIWLGWEVSEVDVFCSPRTPVGTVKVPCNKSLDVQSEVTNVGYCVHL